MSNGRLEAINVKEYYNEDDNFLIGTCPKCNWTNRVEVDFWQFKKRAKCSHCGQKLLFHYKGVERV